MVPTPTLPPDWGKPTPAIVATVEEAAEKFAVPREILYSVIRKESNFNPTLKGYKNATNSDTFRKSYERYKDQVIPGRNPRKLTWGQMFAPEDWTAYGLMQLLPYHIVGKTGGVPVGAPLAKLFDPVSNIRLAAAYLSVLYRKHGTWDEALRIYNGSRVYVRMVLAYVDEFKGAVV